MKLLVVMRMKISMLKYTKYILVFPNALFYEDSYFYVCI